MANSLQLIFNALKSAKDPESVFGELRGNPAKHLRHAFRKLALICHADISANKDKELADECFILLETWKAKAEGKIKRGTYGNKVAQVSLSIKDGAKTYAFTQLICEGELSDVYEGVSSSGQLVIGKIIRDGKNNDLALNESNVLKSMWQSSTKDLEVMSFIPKIVTNIDFLQRGSPRQINIFEYEKGLVTLEQVINAYPNGIDPRDMAWMWNRMIGAMLAAHEAGYVHGAVVPSHFLINPMTHHGSLIDWSYAVKIGGMVKAFSPKYKHFYPSEILSTFSSVGAYSDIYMAAKCAIALLGGDPKNCALPDTVPSKIKGLLLSCTLASTSRRPNCAYQLYEDFGKVLFDLYGKRKFREFAMPDAK